MCCDPDCRCDSCAGLEIPVEGGLAGIAAHRGYLRHDGLALLSGKKNLGVVDAKVIDIFIEKHEEKGNVIRMLYIVSENPMSIPPWSKPRKNK